MEELIVSISGVRGIVGQSLTASVAADYGCAFGTFLKQRGTLVDGPVSVCIGRDSRPSGPMLLSAVAAGLCSVGVNVVDVGLAATPSVGVMLRHLGCAGGVIITASHNPGPYNGIKLLLDNGVAPPKDQADKIRARFVDRRFSLVDSVGCGKIGRDESVGDVHISKVLSIIDRNLIASRRFRVVLDSVNGAGGPVTKKLLGELGCEVYAVNDEPTGLFAHGPEPLAENLGGLCDEVRTSEADVGFAQDPDADRLAIVDEKGKYIGEEYTLALAAKHIFSKCGGMAATNLSTSRMIDDIAAKAGAKVIRTPVGEANVAAAMMENNCVIGGEGNGGVIDLRVGPVRDSLVAIALVLQLMAETGKMISELVREIGGYYMSKDKFRADGRQAEEIFARAAIALAGAKVNKSDGYRFDFEDGWVHIRASNTEPVVRVIVEARDEAVARKYLSVINEVRAQVMGKAAAIERDTKTPRETGG
jgi:phosphomannomutase